MKLLMIVEETKNGWSPRRLPARLGKSGALPALLLSLAACSSPTGPGPEVIGTWGGDNIEARASATAFEAKLRCLTMRARPLVSDDKVGFEIEGVVSEARLTHVIGSPIRVKGRFGADTLYLETSIRHFGFEDWSPYQAHVVVASVEPVYTGGCAV